MDITVNTEVKYLVSKVVINAVKIEMMNGKLQFVAPYAWIDAAGKVLRRGLHQTDEDGLSALGAGAAASLPIIKGLLPEGKYPFVMVNFDQTGVVTDMQQHGMQTVDGKDTWVHVSSTPEELALKIAPLTLEQLSGMIQGMTVQVLG